MIPAASISGSASASDARTATASGAVETLGDDLVRARGFAVQARALMNAMIRAARDTEHDPGRDPLWLTDRLTRVQSEAKRVRARAVYRSAQDVIAAIEAGSTWRALDWAAIDGRLLSLNKLIEQYITGLEEVEADRIAAAPPVSPTDVTAQVEPVSQHAQQAKAAQTLTHLLPHASPQERELLGRLIDVASPETVQTEEPVVPSVSRREKVNLSALEPAMPDLVQDLLSDAREYGKTLSVSYALDGAALPAPQLVQFSDALRARLSDLIASALPLQGVGHIDLAAREDGLHISGSGFDAFDLPFHAESSEPRVQPSLAPDFEAAAFGDFAPVSDFSVLPEPIPAPAPAPATAMRITDEMEAELRRQLGALMDGDAAGAVETTEQIDEAEVFMADDLIVTHDEPLS